ncbi:MAG: VWA domain-containing protein [Caldimonas sp.]
MHAPLTHWLRLLWGTAPPLAFDSDCAYIAAGAIHLPARTPWQHHTAAAAHAAAHLVYSPPRFDGTGLGPIARTLLALLEDARVEALAVRELPGLARLWQPLHTATPGTGVGFEGLAIRLARSLCDPAYDDPDPWVRKGRDLCFLDITLGVCAIRTPADLRDVATRLGHDIGQMRLPFNGKAALPLPAYRDDHRWMWDAAALMEAPLPSLGSAEPDPDPDPDTPDEPNVADPVVTWHPEWDRLIARLRPSWCRVVEAAAPAAVSLPITNAMRSAARQLEGPVRELARHTVRPGRSDTGNAFDLDALVHWQLGHRLRRPTSPRVYRTPRTVAARTALWLLIDQSASTATTARSVDGGALKLSAKTALALGLALRARGVEFGIAAFSSNGRHAVRWQVLKSFTQPVDDALSGRLQALRPEGSTRLGAVLRHATRRLAAERGAQRWVLLLSDGSPHDIDIHDPAYLIEDARHALAGARRQGIRMGCLVVEPDTRSKDAARTFGGNAASRVHGLKDLPTALRRLLD